MNRRMVYAGQQPLETDILLSNKNMMIGLAFLTQALLGTNTYVDGLAIAATSPASLAATIAQGSIYTLATVDATAYSSVAADSNQIVKQGIQYGPITLNFPAPATSGQSINYLVQATYTEADTGAAVLAYYNATNPSQPYAGPANNNTAQPTERDSLCSVTVVAGTAATTGTQSTPSPSGAGVGLYVVTVAYGQTTVTGSNITQLATAPFINPKLSGIAQLIQAQSGNYAIDSGAANAYVISLTPNVTALTAGMPINFKAGHANTGASTIVVNGLSAVSLVRADGTPLQGGDIRANQVVQGKYEAVSNTVQVQNFVAGQVGGTGTVFHHAGYTAPAGAIAADGSALSRSTYANLFSVLTGSIVGSLTSGSSSMTYSAASLGGQSVTPQVGWFISGPGITAGTVYIQAISGTTITLYNTSTSAAYNATATEAAGTSFVLSPFPLGDGSTTFNIPDLRAKFIRGIDNGAGLDVNRVFGSYQLDMFASHIHYAYASPTPINAGTTGYYASSAAGGGYPTSASGGTETAPKNVALLACIKY